MFRNAEELPLALLITCCSLRRSMPAIVPIISASAAAAALQKASMLLTSLATEPMPISPTCTTSPLNDFSSGSCASNTAASPPTMMTIVPSVARGTPPETGASSIWMPLARIHSSPRRAVAGALVERSM